MTPKEKAEDLFSTFCIYPLLKEQAIYLCLKTVDEIVQSQTCCDDFECKHEGSVILKWWGDVKREIQKL